MLLLPRTYRLAICGSDVITELQRDPFPSFEIFTASWISLYGIMVLTGPPASISWDSKWICGFSLSSNTGDMKAPFECSAPKIGVFAPYHISRTILVLIFPIGPLPLWVGFFLPMRPSWLLPELDCLSASDQPFLKCSVYRPNHLLWYDYSSGAVHFWPHLAVISTMYLFDKNIKIRAGLLDILTNIQQFNESASMLNGTASAKILGMRFELSSSGCWSCERHHILWFHMIQNIVCWATRLAGANLRKNARSHNISYHSFGKKLVMVVGFTMAGIPAGELQIFFQAFPISEIESIDMICTATHFFGTIIWWPAKFPRFAPIRQHHPSTKTLIGKLAS